jgi:peptidoglycan/xylan/chitin deacetylase (PgdA/CDA1 family)
VKAVVRGWLLRGLARLERDLRGGGIPSLTYHSLDASGSPVSFPGDYCRAQLDWLAVRGYRSLTAEQAAAALAGAGPLPERAVAITFDDGFRSVREVGFPLLAERGFTATVFCVAGSMGKRCEWPGAPREPALELMSWEEVRFLADRGWEIGGHTVTHARLTELPEAARQEEIEEGRRMVMERAGVPVTSFAYPYGAYDAGCARAAAAAGLASAWTMEPVVNAPGCDRYTLGRFHCNRVQSDSPRAAALAARVCLGGRYGWYAALTARPLRRRAFERER